MAAVSVAGTIFLNLKYKPVSTKKPINIAKLLLGVSSKGGKVATTSIELIAAIPMLPKAILSH